MKKHSLLVILVLNSIGLDLIASDGFTVRFTEETHNVLNNGFAQVADTGKKLATGISNIGLDPKTKETLDNFNKTIGEGIKVIENSSKNPITTRSTIELSEKIHEQLDRVEKATVNLKKTLEKYLPTATTKQIMLGIAFLALSITGVYCIAQGITNLPTQKNDAWKQIIAGGVAFTFGIGALYWNFSDNGVQISYQS